jgi:hypothetical protein
MGWGVGNRPELPALGTRDRPDYDFGPPNLGPSNLGPSNRVQELLLRSRRARTQNGDADHRNFLYCAQTTWARCTGDTLDIALLLDIQTQLNSSAPWRSSLNVGAHTGCPSVRYRTAQY